MYFFLSKPLAFCSYCPLFSIPLKICGFFQTFKEWISRSDFWLEVKWQISFHLSHKFYIFFYEKFIRKSGHFTKFDILLQSNNQTLNWWVPRANLCVSSKHSQISNRGCNFCENTANNISILYFPNSIGLMTMCLRLILSFFNCCHLRFFIHHLDFEHFM